LLFAAERWARENNIRRCIMIAPNERVASVYRRLGYELLETQYIKDLAA
jgi:hypothetical protein